MLTATLQTTNPPQRLQHLRTDSPLGHHVGAPPQPDSKSLLHHLYNGLLLLLPQCLPHRSAALLLLRSVCLGGRLQRRLQQ